MAGSYEDYVNLSEKYTKLIEDYDKLKEKYEALCTRNPEDAYREDFGGKE